MGAVCSDDHSCRHSVALLYGTKYNMHDELPAENDHFEQSRSNDYSRHRNFKGSLRKRLRRSSALYTSENDETVFSIPKQQSRQSFAADKAEPQSLRLRGRESGQDLYDNETKMMVKKALEPILINNVRRIVNDSIDELFRNISSSSNFDSPHGKIQAAKHKVQVNDSSITNHGVNSLEMQNNKVSSRLSVSKLKGEDSPDIPSWKLAWNQGENIEFFSDQSSGTSDLSPGFIGSTHEFSLRDPSSCRRNAGMERVSVIKLGTFHSGISLDKTEVDLNPSTPTSGEPRCLVVNDTGPEKLRKQRTILTDEISIIKLAGDAKISLGESIKFENQHVSKIVTLVPDDIAQSLGNKTLKTNSSVETQAKIKGDQS